MNYFILTILIALNALTVIKAQDIPRNLPSISTQKAAQHLGFLASDSMRGRNTQSPELEKAAEYIANHYKSLGLLPIQGSYFHNYTLERLHLDTPTVCILEKNGTQLPLALKDDFIPFEYSGKQKVYKAAMVFAGYGITASEYSYDDYASIDVKGKIVVILRGEPQSNNEKSIFDGKKNTKYSRMTSKIRLAAQKGAIGMIIINDPLTTLRLKPIGFPWPSLYPNIPADALPLSRKRQGAPDFPIIHVGEKVAEYLFGSVDSLKSLINPIETSLIPASKDLSATVNSLYVTLTTEKVPVRNVMSMLPAEEKTDEYVVIGAHYDHIGTGKPSKPGEDSIYNGADDNASGTTGVLLAAESFVNAKQKPKRNIVFVNFSGEEKGLLGSKAFVDNPPLPIQQCAAMLNMDMIGRNVGSSLFIGGNTRCKELITLNEEENERLFGQDKFALEYTIENFFYRSDQASFALKKIPVIFYFTGEHDDYHKVGDEIEKINLEKLVKITTLCIHTAQKTANLEGRLPFTSMPGDELQE